MIANLPFCLPATELLLFIIKVIRDAPVCQSNQINQ
jgi:hypothetical protein